MADDRTSISWLHVSDLHVTREELGSKGVRRFGGDRWAHALRTFLHDLDHQLHALRMVPDLLLVTGDLAFSGREQKYQDFDHDFLVPLLQRLELRGAKPLLFAVPGNHDVQRPRGLRDKAAYEVLRRYEDDGDLLVAELRRELWQVRDRLFMEPLFPGYLQWMRRTMLPALEDRSMHSGGLRVISHRCSHVPGDVSAIVDKQGMRLLLVGLNSAWMQFDGADFEHKLQLPAAQLLAALHDDEHEALLRFDEVHEALLLTHHPRTWLSETAIRDFDLYVYPASRHHFSAMLCGHLHEARAEAMVHDNGKARYFYQSPSLFGYEYYGNGKPRLDVGYSLGTIFEDGEIRIWPRAVPRESRELRFDVDVKIEGRERDGSFVLRPPQRRQDDTKPQVIVPMAATGDAWSTISDAELRGYETKIVALHHEMRLAGFETKVRVPIELDDLYVPLNAGVDHEVERRQIFHSGDYAEGHEEIALAQAFEIARKRGRAGTRGVVLLGDPGSGKTTYLKQVLLKVVRDGAESIGLPKQIVPVFLPLRHLRDLDAGLPAFIQQELQDPMLGVSEGFGERLCKRGHLLFLLDGLDEVANADHRRKVARWIEHARRSKSSNYFLVSCRFSGYTLDAQLDEHFLALRMRPLTTEKVEMFVRRWYRVGS